MTIDMTPEAVTRRLYQVDALRQLCLSLARSSAGRTIAEKHSHLPTVKRTATALGLVINQHPNHNGELPKATSAGQNRSPRSTDSSTPNTASTSKEQEIAFIEQKIEAME